MVDCYLGGKLDPEEISRKILPSISDRDRDDLLSLIRFVDKRCDAKRDFEPGDLWSAYSHGRYDIVDNLLDMHSDRLSPEVIMRYDDVPRFIRYWRDMSPRLDDRHRHFAHGYAYKSGIEELWRMTEETLERDHEMMFYAGCVRGNMELLKKGLKGYSPVEGLEVLDRRLMFEDHLELIGRYGTMEMVDLIFSLPGAPRMTETMMYKLISSSLRSTRPLEKLFHLKEIGRDLIRPDINYAVLSGIKGLDAFLQVFPPGSELSPKLDYEEILRSAIWHGNEKMIRWLLAHGVPMTDDIQVALAEYDAKWNQ
jgi:hypothetical protein